MTKPLSLLLAIVAITALLPALAAAHSAGPFDPHGCHDDRRRGGYHCHLGEFAGLEFSSKSAMLDAKKSGKTASELRKEQGLVEESADQSEDGEEEGGWRSWLPFGGDDSESHEVTTGGVIVPRGIEDRLKVLKDLHEKGLITDEEYAEKRKEILGEL